MSKAIIFLSDYDQELQISVTFFGEIPTSWNWGNDLGSGHEKQKLQRGRERDYQTCV